MKNVHWHAMSDDGTGISCLSINISCLHCLQMREESVLNTCASNSSQKQFYLTERNTPRGLETCSCFRVFDCGTRVWELSGRTVRVRIVIETLVSKHHEIHEIQNGLKTSLSLSLPIVLGPYRLHYNGAGLRNRRFRCICGGYHPPAYLVLEECECTRETMDHGPASAVQGQWGLNLQ